MIVVGAKGFAKEILQVVSVDLGLKDTAIVFFDNVSTDVDDYLFDRFKVLRSYDDVELWLNSSIDKEFVLGIGSPYLRQKMYNKFVSLNATPKTVVAKNVEIGDFDIRLGNAIAIMSGTILTNSISVGHGCLINLNCTIGHDCVIGDFVEMSPNVNLSGRCVVGKLTTIGTSAVILPNIVIGENVTIGAGAVITKDIPDNAVVVGIPGKIIKFKDVL
ncbi:MAG: acetyltransferase [Jejuia sp.]